MKKYWWRIKLYNDYNVYFDKKVYIAIYLISFIFVFFNLQTLMNPFMFVIAKNERYINLVEGSSSNGYLSLGILMQIFNYIILLLFLLKNEMHKKQPLFFNLFFISCVLMNMRVGAPLMNRVMMYFSWFSFVLLPLTLIEEKSSRTKSLIKIYEELIKGKKFEEKKTSLYLLSASALMVEVNS